jgi:CRP-like cAMP-binding protein
MQYSDLSPFDGLRLLDGVTRRQRRAISHLGTTLDLRAGVTLGREGAESRELVVVVSGVVALTRDGALQGLLRPGDAWGDGGLFATRLNTTAVTARAVRVHAYNVRETRALTRACPALAQRLLRTGTERGLGLPAHAIPPKVPVRAFRETAQVVNC